ncbi:Ig-like domain-containing protein [Candidatus Poribacteria bacterium]|nr:Ig-like domain-containing protein [Candidatus Poribacteria bacterium]
MKILRCLSICVQICVLAIILSGAAGGGDCNADFGGEEPSEADAAFVEADPPSGDFAANGRITVTFDDNPGDVTVGPEGIVAGSGKTRTIVGPFTPGALKLTLFWTNGDGSHTLTYNIIAVDTTAPILTGGTVKDGEEDVDYEAINEGKTIKVTFSEEVSGNITLQTEGGDDIGWIGKVDGTEGTLELVVGGKEIDPKTTYVIKGKITDAAGNETEVSISFTTKDKA